MSDTYTQETEQPVDSSTEQPVEPVPTETPVPTEPVDPSKPKPPDSTEPPVMPVTDRTTNPASRDPKVPPRPTLTKPLSVMSREERRAWREAQPTVYRYVRPANTSRPVSDQYQEVYDPRGSRVPLSDMFAGRRVKDGTLVEITEEEYEAAQQQP